MPGLQQSADVMPRRFCLERKLDVSGISGTGIVAFGVQWPDGKVLTRWNGKISQTCTWDCIEDVIEIHGHGGHTRVVWLDPEPGAENQPELFESDAERKAREGFEEMVSRPTPPRMVWTD